MTKTRLIQELNNEIKLLTERIEHLTDDELDSLYSLLVLVEKDGIDDVMKRYRQGCIAQFLGN